MKTIKRGIVLWSILSRDEKRMSVFKQMLHKNSITVLRVMLKMSVITMKSNMSEFLLTF